jgi:putative transposase
MYFNAKHGFVGHAWQGRPKIFVMDDSYWRNAVRYVERNPVRAGMVRAAEDYLWSSAAAHCNLRDDSLLSMAIPWMDEIANWSQWLETAETAAELKRIRTHIELEKPLGTNEFLAQLECATGRKLLPQRRGRPKKAVALENQLPLKIGELPV